MQQATYRDGFTSGGHSAKVTLRPVSRAHTLTSTEDEMNARTRVAARAALETHDALNAVYVVEPTSDSDGVPIDPDAWQRWYDTMQKPAYARWDEAMRDLAAELGEPGMSRHPFNFRPRCKAILKET